MNILNKILALSAAFGVVLLLDGRNVVVSFSPTPIVSVVRPPTPQDARSSSYRCSFLGAAPQILEFQEPKTNTTVMLIGAMHYNPSSVKLVRDTLESLHNQDRLGPVIVESCDIRWNKTEELYKEKPFLKNILENEMRTACDLALQYNQPVILGDQKINVTTDAMKSTLKDTLLDLVTPPIGWKRFATEVSQAWGETVPLGGKGYLNALAFIDPRLILALPVSLIKYPLSFLLRDPVPTSVVLTLLVGLSYDDPTSLDSLFSQDIPLSDYLLSFFVAFLETVVFARVLLKPLLAERNVILASSILKQCELVQRKSTETASRRSGSGGGGIFGMMFQNNQNFLQSVAVTNAKDSSNIDQPTIYAPGSIVSEDMQWKPSSDRVVVAVLGMAHCNGIKKVMNEI